MTLVLLPAVDVADGAAVRLVQGAAGTETSYGSPLDAALHGFGRHRLGEHQVRSVRSVGPEQAGIAPDSTAECRCS